MLVAAHYAVVFRTCFLRARGRGVPRSAGGFYSFRQRALLNRAILGTVYSLWS